MSESPVSWTQAVFVGSQDQAAAAADYLVLLTGRGVEWRELPGQPELCEVVAYLYPEPDPQGQIEELQNYVRNLRQLAGPAPEIYFQEMPDQDWAENWRKHFEPQEVTSRLLVAPPWREASPRPGQRCMIIDPGQAFGTGQHHSTALCLECLEELERAHTLPEVMLDVGCGTGILALAYLLMQEQGQAWGLDIDPLALAAARHNAQLNHLEERLHLSGGGPQELTAAFPLITANLTADILTALAPVMRARLAPGLSSRLIAAGLLTYQVPQVTRAFQEQGLRPLLQRDRAEWTCLVLSPESAL